MHKSASASLQPTIWESTSPDESEAVVVESSRKMVVVDAIVRKITDQELCEEPVSESTRPSTTVRTNKAVAAVGVAISHSASMNFEPRGRADGAIIATTTAATQRGRPITWSAGFLRVVDCDGEVEEEVSRSAPALHDGFDKSDAVVESSSGSVSSGSVAAASSGGSFGRSQSPSSGKKSRSQSTTPIIVSTNFGEMLIGGEDDDDDDDVGGGGNDLGGFPDVVSHLDGESLDSTYDCAPPTESFTPKFSQQRRSSKTPTVSLDTPASPSPTTLPQLLRGKRRASPTNLSPLPRPQRESPGQQQAFLARSEPNLATTSSSLLLGTRFTTQRLPKDLDKFFLELENMLESAPETPPPPSRSATKMQQQHQPQQLSNMWRAWSMPNGELSKMAKAEDAMQATKKPVVRSPDHLAPCPWDDIQRVSQCPWEYAAITTHADEPVKSPRALRVSRNRLSVSSSIVSGETERAHGSRSRNTSAIPGHDGRSRSPSKSAAATHPPPQPPPKSPAPEKKASTSTTIVGDVKNALSALLNVRRSTSVPASLSIADGCSSQQGFRNACVSTVGDKLSRSADDDKSPLMSTESSMIALDSAYGSTSIVSAEDTTSTTVRKASSIRAFY